MLDVVFCDRRPLAAAKHSKTASSCARSHFLLEYLTSKTLLKSSLRGGKSRTSQDVNQSEMSIEQGEGVHYTRSVHIKDSLFE